jgi:glycosyltransferase involved in cell wall biosynthesis
LARRYVDALFPVLWRLVDGAVAHSEHDRPALEERFGLGHRPLVTVPHGPHHTPAWPKPRAVTGPCTLLYFGVIRPYKGLEDLVRAFGRLSRQDAEGLRLLVVGETWEGHRLPLELIAACPHRDRSEVVNRYVTDEELVGFLAAADAMVLPYRRSSASGPLHLAMSAGLPVVVSAVGGLVEAVRGYEGAVLVPPRDVDELAGALLQVAELRGRHFADPHSWDRTLDGFGELFDAVAGERRAVRPPSSAAHEPQACFQAARTTSAAALPRTE